MFDIGFWELAIIALVALIVIGPDKLPAVARTVGKWVGRTRRFVNQVKNDIDREIRQDEIRKALENETGLSDIKKSLDDEQFSFEEEKDYLVTAINEADPASQNNTGDSETEQHPVAPDNTVDNDRQ